MWWKKILMLGLVSSCFSDDSDTSGGDIATRVNESNSTWRARSIDVGASETIMWLGELEDTQVKLPLRKQIEVRKGLEKWEPPECFDARERWPMCPTLFRISDQGACASCWAVSSSDAMTDRICIHSSGLVNTEISAQDMLTCCPDCGRYCKGGFSARAWKHWANPEGGVVSGGHYQSEQGCKPYEISGCTYQNENVTSNPARQACAKFPPPDTKCVKQCSQSYEIDYNDDKNYGYEAYSIGKSEKEIMWEVYHRGPCTVSFQTYADFKFYKSGVYQHVHGNRTGNHAVRLLGWGEEAGVPYWLIANSWNTDWGDKGYFKFLRGVNHLNIESYGLAGMPYF